MKDANASIFKKLAFFVTDRGGNIDTSNCRYINTNAQEKEYLKKIKIIDERLIVTRVKTALFEFNDEKYFAAIGFQNQEEIDTIEAIEFIDMNAGILTALLYELEVPLIQRTSYLEIVNEIFYEQSDDEDGIDFNCVSKFFEPLCIYKIHENSPFIEQGSVNLTRLSGFYILKNAQLISLGFLPSTLEKFEKIFCEGSEAIPYDNLLLSLVSISWRHSFLDIYRCIERLFCVPALEDFHIKLQIKNSLLQFSADIEEHIDWRPKEKESLNKLFKQSPKEVIDSLKEIKSIVDGTEEGKYGELIYKIRNSIVHFRPANQNILSSLKDRHWDIIINSSLSIVEYLYGKYNLQLKI